MENILFIPIFLNTNSSTTNQRSLDLGNISVPLTPKGSFQLVCSWEWYSYSYIKPEGDDGRFLCVDLKDKKGKTPQGLVIKNG